MGRPNPSRGTEFSDANRDMEMFIFPVQSTTSRIGSPTRLIPTLLFVMNIHTTYYVQRSTVSSLFQK